MEIKYYTPEIEEFYVGFEYEWDDSMISQSLAIREPAQWHKSIFWGEETKETFSIINRSIEVGDVRVKHLDKADIEELGFTEGTGHYSQIERELFYNDYQPFYLQKDHCTYLIDYYENRDMKLIISIYNNQTMSLGERHHLFNGTVKNKSELKKLLKMLNVKTSV